MPTPPLDPPYDYRQRPYRVVLTGGPGGGKTTAADLFRRELGPRVVIVPETATMLFSGGFPRCHDDRSRRSAQTAIFHVQRNLEDIQSAMHPGRILLCDRGTIDGAAYWPGAPGDFFAANDTTLQAELARYDEVIFFETAAVGGIDIEGGNPTRIEDTAQAVALDGRLRRLWQGHPRFALVEHDRSFLQKITRALDMLSAIVERFDQHGAPTS